jgi:hypothetical protein
MDAMAIHLNSTSTAELVRFLLQFPFHSLTLSPPAGDHNIMTRPFIDNSALVLKLFLLFVIANFIN